jgi:YVTN family beta-propeller protein
VVYVTSENDGEVYAIDTASNTVAARIAVGHRPRSIAFLPDGSRAYVTLENDAAIAVVDAARHALLETIALGAAGVTPRPRPMGLAVRADGTLVCASAGSFGSVFFLDPAGGAAPASLAVGARPWGVAFTSDGRTLFTANGPSNDVSVVDVAARRVLKKIPAGDRPWGVAVLERAGPGGN